MTSSSTGKGEVGRAGEQKKSRGAAVVDNSNWCANRNGFSSCRSFGLSGCVVAASACFGTREEVVER